MKSYPFNRFKYGIANKLPIQSIPDGAAYDSLNWVTEKGKISLARGYAVLGTTIAGVGRVSGLKVATNPSGRQIPFASYARKVRYYNSTLATPDWVEISSDILPAAASGEDITFDLFDSRAGKQIWFNSPNTGPYKVMLTNPDTAISMYDSSVNYKAWMRIFDNRAYNWYIDNSDKTVVRQSYIETRGLSDYLGRSLQTIGLGDSVTTAFSGNLFTAQGILTCDGTTPSDGDTVTIDAVVYTWKTALGGGGTVPYQVLIGGSSDQALLNLDAAINASGTAGTTYGTGTARHTTVFGGMFKISNKMYVYAKTGGTGGNAIATSSLTTGSHTVWGATTLQGGGQGKKTIITLSVTDGSETFTDDGNGVLTSNLGGTGTINYATGDYTLAWNTAPVLSFNTNLPATYSYVDETAAWGSHGGGIANFLVPASRVSGEPNVFRQDKGGSLKNIVALKDHKFCIHENAVWEIIPSLDDTLTTNTLFRDTIGISYLRGAYAAPEGIYTVDTRDPGNPRFGIIQYSAGSTDIKPRYISEDLNLTGYVFDSVVVFPFADYILYSCRTTDSLFNNRTFAYNRIYKTFDLLDYPFTVADIYNGTLIAGDSLSNNVMTLFSGLDANGDVITNQWTSGISKLGYITPRGKIIIIRALKKVKKLILEGDIGPDQVLHMYVSLDRGPFVEVLDEEGQPVISGNGTYVDRSQAVTIGASTLGSRELGGGGTGIEAYHYDRVVKFPFDKFVDVQIKFQAGAVGYLSISNLEFQDIRVLQSKPARKYRVE